MTLRDRVSTVLNSQDTQAGRIYGIVMMTLVMLNVIMIFVGTLDLPDAAVSAVSAFDVFSIVVFSIDYVLRIWTAPSHYSHSRHPRVRYIFSPMGLVDLISVLPFYLPGNNVDLRSLRLFRLMRLARVLRVFKLAHYSKGLQSVWMVLKQRRSQLLSSVFFIAILIVISASIMYDVESSAQPELFRNGFDALWWAVATLTTVGYGDIYPVTALGRVMSSIIALLGIGIVAVPSGIIAAGFTQNDDAGSEERIARRVVDLLKEADAEADKSERKY